MADEPSTTTALTTTQPRQAIVVEHFQPLLDTGRFEQMQRASRALMNSSLLNESVRGNSPEQCFSNLLVIFDYAERWKVPAVMLSQCVSIVHGKLMWEGKAVAAAIEATLGVALDYQWNDAALGSDAYGIRVFGDLPGRGEREITGTVGDWKTFQKDGRTVNPAWKGAASKMQLAYRGAREWARLWAPAVMLGVYGDDEVQAWEDRAPVYIGASSAAPAITAGFTAPKATTAEPEAAEVVDQDGVVSDLKVVEETLAADAKPPKKSKAQEKDEDRNARVKLETEARLAKCADQEKAGLAAGLSGEAMVVPTGLTEEETRYWRNGFTKGVADRQEQEKAADPKAAATAAGQDAADEHLQGIFDAWEKKALAGEDPPGADMLTAEEHEAAMEGWHAGQAVRVGGQDQDDTPADEEDEDESAFEAAPDAFDTFTGMVRDLPDWPSVKAALNDLARSEDWKVELKRPGGSRIRVARVTAWTRVQEIAKADADLAVDPSTDVTAFRCFQEAEENADRILEAWQSLVDTDGFKNASQEAQDKLQSVTMNRMQQLRG